MMDFDNVLSIATQNKGPRTAQQKRYSLQAGPPKKDPRSKGVNPAAVKALLKKQCCDAKVKELEMKKQKGELLAKRVEMKSDRKARAMASRTKDNFKGYNGIPVVELPKKRRSKEELEKERSMDGDSFRNYSIDPEDDEDNYEYEQTDSEPEKEPEPPRPGKISGGIESSSFRKPSSKKPGGPPKAAPPAMNFADLLKLAEQKQFEPVELKSKVAKKEGRLRTADEIKELEMERKAKRRDKDPMTERERDHKSQSSSSSVKKNTLEKKNCKPQKNYSEKPSQPSGTGKRSHPTPPSDKLIKASSKNSISDRERERPKTSPSDRERSKASLSSSSRAINNKVPPKPTSQVSGKQGGPRPSSSHKSIISSDLDFNKESSSSIPRRPSGVPGSRPPGTSVPGHKTQYGNSQQTRPIQGSSLKQGPIVAGHKPGKREPSSSGSSSALKSSGNSVVRPSSSGTLKTGNQPQARHGGPVQARAGGAPQARPGGSSLQGNTRGGGTRPPGIGPGRTGNGIPGPGRPTGSFGSGPGRPTGNFGSGPGRPTGSFGSGPGKPSGSFGSGPGRPKCTVVSETISSKDLAGSRPGCPPRPGMPHRPGLAPRAGMPTGHLIRPPGTMLPPITSAYKRKYEDEEDEYDSEMDDFIDDADEGRDEISKHIKEIFGYDRSKYRDESDYALTFMESSWRDMQKEEARSLRLAVQEDLEEERKEEEEIKRNNVKRKKRN